MPYTEDAKIKDKYFQSSVDKQRAYLHRIARTPAPCPACGVLSSKYTASGDRYSVAAPGVWPDGDFACPACDTPLWYCLGLFDGVPFWVTHEQHERSERQRAAAIAAGLTR